MKSAPSKNVTYKQLGHMHHIQASLIFPKSNHSAPNKVWWIKHWFFCDMLIIVTTYHVSIVPEFNGQNWRNSQHDAWFGKEDISTHDIATNIEGHKHEAQRTPSIEDAKYITCRVYIVTKQTRQYHKDVMCRNCMQEIKHYPFMWSTCQYGMLMCECLQYPICLGHNQFLDPWHHGHCPPWHVVDKIISCYIWY